MFKFLKVKKNDVSYKEVPSRKEEGTSYEGIKSTWGVPIIILIFAIAVSIPLLSHKFNIYFDDGVQHISRLMGTLQSIEEGQIIPAIMSNFCNGFGYSWNIFYSPLTAYLPLIFLAFTNSFELMLKLFIILVGFLSGIAMYKFVYKISKNRFAGLLSAIIYICAPYRLTDVYIRVAVSELTSFIFLPIVFLGMYNIFNCNPTSKDAASYKENFAYIKDSLFLTLGAVGLILSHSVIAMYTAIICFIYVLINIKQLKNKQVLKVLAINILLILLITSFYTVPLLEHKLATNYEVFKPGRMERTEALIYLKVDAIDLINSGNDNMNFEIGLISIIGLVLTILAHKKVEKNSKKMYWFSLITGIICVIISLRFFPFEKLPAILKMLQFTFRLLEFSSFFFAVIAGINYSLAIKNFKLRDVLILGTISFLLVIPMYSKINFNKQKEEEELWKTVKVDNTTGRVHAGCASFEYLPSKAFEHLDYIKTRENRVYVLAEDGNYVLPEASGKIIIENEEKDGTNLNFNIKISTTANEVDNAESLDTVNGITLELPYIYYLGYNVEMKISKTNDDGTTTEEITSIETFESENGFVAIKLPSEILKTYEIDEKTKLNNQENSDHSTQAVKTTEEHTTSITITTKYTGTTLMKITYIVSILSAIGAVFLATYLLFSIYYSKIVMG